MKNPCAKTRPPEDPYEIWKNVVPVLDCDPGTWTWHVLKKWQRDDDKPGARWFCNVVTPIMPEGELGDVFVEFIKSVARRIK